MMNGIKREIIAETFYTLYIDSSFCFGIAPFYTDHDS